eukprot:6200571-Pleurochrysis_carterae.AAC.3
MGHSDQRSISVSKQPKRKAAQRAACAAHAARAPSSGRARAHTPPATHCNRPESCTLSGRRQAGGEAPQDLKWSK